MEGTGKGKQRHVLFRIILDEAIDSIIDDIEFPIGHVCGCRSGSLNDGLGRMSRGNMLHVRPKGLSEGKEPVASSSGAGTGSVTVPSATVYG